MKNIVIVTGASTGIGRDAAHRLAAAGYRVFAGVRKLPGDGHENPNTKQDSALSPLLLDVTSAASVAAAVENIRPELEEADSVHLVNNAGIAVTGPVEAVAVGRWEEQFAVNVFGLVRVTQALLPHIRRTQGRIVNISSVSGLASPPYLGPYSASKFAVEALSDSLRRELRQFGVKVVVVEPGPVATPIWEKGLARKEEITRGAAPGVAALYRRELDKFIAAAAVSAKDAVPVSAVSDVILRALTTARPRTRYVVGGKGIALQAAVLPFLPDSWLDSLVAKEFR